MLARLPQPNHQSSFCYPTALYLVSSFAQSNGNVAILEDGNEHEYKWQTATSGSTTFALMMQADGVLALLE
jgi:hypothetical protein